MPFENFTNFARSTLAGAMTNVATTLSVAPGDGAKFPPAAFHLAIEAEVMWCTSRATDVLTVIRAQQGTTAVAHALGATVIHGAFADDLKDRERVRVRLLMTPGI